MQNRIMQIKAVLCSGRHSFPESIENCVFSNAISDPTDIVSIRKEAETSLIRIFRKEGAMLFSCPFENSCADCGSMCSHCDEGREYVDTSASLNLYVTGLTVALIEVLNVCKDWGISVTLYHYDRESGNYFPQKVG